MHRDLVRAAQEADLEATALRKALAAKGGSAARLDGLRGRGFMVREGVTKATDRRHASWSLVHCDLWR